jgi:hypothetical protein
MPKTHIVDEPDTLEDKLKEEDVEEGDIIEYNPYAQHGRKKYKVILIDGEKSVEDITEGGMKKNSRKSRTNRRKSRTNRRKSRTHRRKSRTHRRK